MTLAIGTEQTETQFAREVAAALKKNNVHFLFGIPGGGSSVDLIEACRREEIPFVLVQHETTAAMMAVVSGELTNSCGACISIMGPGATNLTSGAIYAYLERHPLICFTETYGPGQAPLTSMQKIDHSAMFDPICKASITLDANEPESRITEAIHIANTERPGPVHVDLPMDFAPSIQTDGHVIRDQNPNDSHRIDGDLKAISATIDQANKPVLVVGPVVLRHRAQDDLLSLAEKIQAAVMVTSKARGAIPEDHPLYAGIMSGVYREETFEGRMMAKSDLVLAVGLDRTELLSPWKHTQPLLTLDAVRVPSNETVGVPLLAATGPLPHLLASVTTHVQQRQTWNPSEIQDFWSAVSKELGAESPDLNAASALYRARQIAPRDAILTTEAGIYGRVNLYAWKVYEPGTYFDSSGTNTMGYSVPAALAASLVRPSQKTIALVGDAGMLMRAGELETAARLKLAPVIIVFDDGTLGMIRIKQQAKEYARVGVDLAQTNFVQLAESFGGVGWEVHSLEEFEIAFNASMESDRLHLIDVRVDPDVYAAHTKPIRGQ